MRAQKQSDEVRFGDKTKGPKNDCGIITPAFFVYARAAMASLDNITRTALAALRPPPKVTLSRWIESNGHRLAG